MIWRVSFEISYVDMHFDFEKASAACEFAKILRTKCETDREFKVSIEPIEILEQKERED